MYCVRCGRNLPGKYNKCRKCRPDASPTAWFCPYCGSGVKKNAKVCDVCHEKLDLSPAMYVVTEVTPPKSRKVACTLAFLLGFTGLHMRYLGFQEKFLRRIIWSALSVVVSVASLIAFRNGIQPAFAGGYNAEILDSMAAFVIAFAALIAAGALSFLLSWLTGIYDGINMLANKKYADAEGTPLR